MKMIIDQKLNLVYRIVKEIGPKLPYHNYEHAVEVVDTCRKYARLDDLSEEQTEIVVLAGLLHDIIFIPGRADNEERSAEFAEDSRQWLRENRSRQETGSGSGGFDSSSSILQQMRMDREIEKMKCLNRQLELENAARIRRMQLNLKQQQLQREMNQRARQ